MVTRYFGGILLGGGGLVRAYSHATSIAMDSASIMDMCSCYQLKFSMDYTLYGKVNYILPNFDIKILDTNFSNCVTITLLVKVERFEELNKKLIDVSNGSIVVEKSQEMFMDFN